MGTCVAPTVSSVVPHHSVFLRELSSFPAAQRGGTCNNSSCCCAAMASPIVRYEKSEIVVMRRGDVVDRQESERVTDGKGSTISGSDAGAAAPNKGVSTAQVQLLPHGEDAAEPRAGGRAQGGPDKVHVPRLLDPLKLGAIASTAFGAFVCATKRDASRARAFWPRSPLLPAAADDDGSYYYPAPRLDPHLVALNALLGAAYMSLGAAQGVMSLTSDRAPRRLFHLWNVAQTLLNQLTVTRCRRRGFADQPVRVLPRCCHCAAAALLHAAWVSAKS